jgi:hypothetical protein
VTSAQQGAPAAGGTDVTFSKDIAPILQRSCQQCHRPGGVAPMPLITYEQVRPWARAIKTRTGLGPRAGVMPPWFVEKDLGIQKFKNDISPTEAELARIAEWVDSGAPQGDPAHLPKPLDFDISNKWTIGEPDLVLRGPDGTVPAIGPDRWTKLPSIPSGLRLRRTICASSRHGETFGVYMNAVARRWPAMRFARRRSGPFSGYTWKSAAPGADGGT